MNENFSVPIKLSNQNIDIIIGFATAGSFETNEWHIVVSKRGNSYIYTGKNPKTNTSITLFKGRLTKSIGKHIYKWNNADTIYQVIWRLADHSYARLQVFDQRGTEILNKSLRAIDDV